MARPTTTESPPKRRTRTKAPGVYRSVSGSYEIAYRDSDGRHVFKVVEGGFEDAKAARADIVGKLSRGEPIRNVKATFGEFAETVYEGLTGRPQTLAVHRWALDSHLLPRFRNRKLADITTDDVARLVAEMGRGVRFEKVGGRLVRTRREKGKGYSGSTTSAVVKTLGVVLGKAKRRGLIPANPVADLERRASARRGAVMSRAFSTTPRSRSYLDRRRHVPSAGRRPDLLRSPDRRGPRARTAGHRRRVLERPAGNSVATASRPTSRPRRGRRDVVPGAFNWQPS